MDARQRLELVIKALRVHGKVNVACRQAQFGGRSLSKETFYEMRERFPDFEQEVVDAMAQCKDELEADGTTCARKAVKDPRYWPALKFALQCLCGWTTKERVEHTGPNGGPIRVDTHKVSEEQAADLYRKALDE